MENERKLTCEEFAEIKRLVNEAIMARNKKMASTYINRLELMKSTLEIKPNIRNILAELIAYVKEASGQVREKEHWVSAVNQSLYKLKTFQVENNKMT